MRDSSVFISNLMRLEHQDLNKLGFRKSFLQKSSLLGFGCVPHGLGLQQCDSQRNYGGGGGFFVIMCCVIECLRYVLKYSAGIQDIDRSRVVEANISKMQSV